MPIDINAMDDELRFGMPGGTRMYGDKRHGGYEYYGVPTTRWRQWAAIDLQSFGFETGDVDGYEGEDGDDALADEEHEAAHADD
jgi:hypothetical protein